MIDFEAVDAYLDTCDDLQKEFSRRFDPWWHPRAWWFMLSGDCKRNIADQKVLLDKVDKILHSK